MKRSLLLLVLAVTPAGAQPDAGAPAVPPPALAAELAKVLEPELAKVELRGALPSYQKLPLDSTLAGVSKRLHPGKRDCDEVTAPSFCPKSIVHVPLGEGLSGWFVGGQLYRLERVVYLPSWAEKDRAEFEAAFDALVTARLPGGKIVHDNGVYWRSLISYDVGGQQPLSLSLDMTAGGVSTVKLELVGKSSARADKLAELEEKQHKAAEAVREMAANRQSCKCKLATIGSRWPVRNGHAAPHPDDGRWQVVSVDAKHCQAVVKDTMMGGEDTWSCTQFVLPRSNPAGAREVRHPALACSDILKE